MKILNKILKVACLAAILLVTQSWVVSDEVEGTWMYQATNTSEEYSKGEIMITENEGEYTVVLSVNYSKIDGTKVSVEENMVKFSINVEGTDVDVYLEIAGDKFTGKAASDEGTYALTGTRKSS